MKSTSQPEPIPSKSSLHSDEQYTNHLYGETSPYLLQHAHNPVHWYPWGDAAFEKAREEDKPVFLSVGYSSCHWCHVMEHESFENEEVASWLNKSAIAIKVDREERPDIDEIYMTATQLMTGRGGWPNSVWLTPDRKPWYAGTYYPAQSFIQLIQQIDQVWNTRRDDVLEQAEQLTKAIRDSQSISHTLSRTQGALNSSLLANADREIQARFDKEFGGFGGAPKFPPHATLRYLLQQPQNPVTDEILQTTLNEMAAGGIRDHIGGGFHRYATDEKWFLPHFEKMLYDNAQLLWIYSEAAYRFHSEAYRQVVTELVDWSLQHFRHPDGGFYSAFDADSEGVEGKFYLWTYPEIIDILGNSEGEAFADLYQIRPEGNYYEEATRQQTEDNIPYLKLDDDHDLPESPTWIGDAKTTLREHRDHRVPPFLDDKVITSWNGLMISGLARAARRLDDQDLLKEAEKTASFILDTMNPTQNLIRLFRQGATKGSAYLEDYAYLADGLIELYEASSNRVWLVQAEALLNKLDASFAVEDGDAYYQTSADHEDLLSRSVDPLDNATPSGNAVAARAWIRLAEHRKSEHAFQQAESMLQQALVAMEKLPSATATFHETLSLYLQRASPEPEQGNSEVEGQRVEVIEASLIPGTEPDSYLLTLKIDAGWHIQSASPVDASLIPTRIEPTSSSLQLDSIQYPDGTSLDLPGFDKPLDVYTGSIQIKFVVHPMNRPSQEEASIDLKWQACDDHSCREPSSMKLLLPKRSD